MRPGAGILPTAMSDHDPFDLDLLEEDADRRRALSQLANENDDADFMWLMSGPKGRRFVRRLLGESGTFSTSFHPNAMEMSRQEGKRQVGLWVLGQIERLCPEAYTTMNKEHEDVRAASTR